ncbi:hypothetical protein [Hymenobacter koreensis]|uniref:hypothetical protein n=1 Tax=Hymenobacter koreensis TaxID=1084523 RepID=UPI0031E6F70D
MLAGCGKSESEKEYVLKGDYQTQNPLTVTAPILYTRQGPVTNPQVIQQFLARLNNTGFVFGTSQTLSSNSLLSFRDDKTASIVFQAPQGTAIEARLEEKTSDRIVLVGRDSIAYSQAPNPVLVVQNINQYKVAGRCRPVPPASGFISPCKGAVRYPINRTADGQLRIPLLSFLHKVTYPGGMASNSGINVWGVFNSAVLGQLGATDTLVVQTKELPLLKQ